MSSATDPDEDDWDEADFWAQFGTADGGKEDGTVTLDDFTAVDEPGAEALVGAGDEDAFIPEGGDVMVYGDGGAGKTTLMVDLAFHAAAGEDWLGIPIQRPLRVLLIENEGPRPMLRRKLARKLEAWNGGDLGGRLRIHEQPWGEVCLKDFRWRTQLEVVVMEHEIDLIIAGPLIRLGMNEAGTLQEVNSFMALVRDVREGVQEIGEGEHSLAVALIHHENKSGTVSGAWEQAGDTLLHVSSGGNGHTIVFVQKARWATDRHRQTLTLAWEAGEGFRVEEEVERDYHAEIVELLAGGRWLTAKEIASPTTGIGAGTDTVREVLEGDPETFERRTGEAAKALHRSSTAVLYGLTSAPKSHESPRSAPRQEERTSDSGPPVGGSGGVSSPDGGGQSTDSTQNADGFTDPLQQREGESYEDWEQRAERAFGGQAR